jgi:iron(III) transport system substrate-binding protein
MLSSQNERQDARTPRTHFSERNDAKTQRGKTFFASSRRCIPLSILPWLLGFLAFAFTLNGCEKPTNRQVILYTSVDQPIAQPIIRAFEEKTGINVTLVTDAEASKTVGLVERLRAEKSNPQCDVFWNNEPFHMIALAAEGVLAPYESPVASRVPARFKDPQNLWASCGVRVRYLVAHKSGEIPFVDPGTPAKIDLLKDPRFRGKIAIARPNLGTCAGHIASIYVERGDDAADQLMRDFKANDLKLVGGNSVVAEEVSKGTLWLGITDNDDAAASPEGTLLAAPAGEKPFPIPTTIALIAGSRHTPEAKQLIDFLLSEEVEKKLIEARYAFLPVTGAQEKTDPVDFQKIAQKLPDAIRRAITILESRE